MRNLRRRLRCRRRALRYRANPLRSQRHRLCQTGLMAFRWFVKAWRRATAVLPDYRSNSQIRQSSSGICSDDSRVIPVANLAKKNSRVSFSRKPQVSGEIGKIVDEHDRAGSRGQHDDAFRNFAYLLIRHGRVAGSEVHQLFFFYISPDESLDSFAAADGLIGDECFGLPALVNREPSFVQPGKVAPAPDDTPFGGGLIMESRSTAERIQKRPPRPSRRND